MARYAAPPTRLLRQESGRTTAKHPARRQTPANVLRHCGKGQPEGMPEGATGQRFQDSFEER
jgi:hypothetical protein